MISSEIPEILAGCDRVVVFRQGRRVAELPAAQTTPEQLLHWFMQNGYPIRCRDPYLVRGFCLGS
jgi:ABC-type sugar transport system ATPase subunit